MQAFQGKMQFIFYAWLDIEDRNKGQQFTGPGFFDPVNTHIGNSLGFS